MSANKYETMVRKHWAKWLPKRVAALKEAGDWDSTVQTVAKQTAAQVVELMGQGFRQHEAEEVALHERVLLKPEADADLEPWERAEMAKMEKSDR